jgi:hypothetical protein
MRADRKGKGGLAAAQPRPSFVNQFMELDMAILLLIVGYIVFLAERLAFCLMLYMLLTWTLSVIEQPLRRLHRWVVHHVSQLRWVREAVQFWTALRLVRRQVMP